MATKAQTPSIPHERRKQYMDLVMDFMIKDSERAIKEGCNYLVALGLSAYTEIIGGLCYRNLQGNYKKNYDRFLKNYFDDLNGCEYMKVDKQLTHLGGLYGVVRVEVSDNRKGLCCHLFTSSAEMCDTV